MNEKELLKSERGHQIFWICIIILAVGIVAFVAGIFYSERFYQIVLIFSTTVVTTS